MKLWSPNSVHSLKRSATATSFTNHKTTKQSEMLCSPEGHQININQ